MADPLDVSLRVRMRYEAAGTATKVIGDLDQVRTKATQLGAIAVGDRLGRGLRDLSDRLQSTTRDVTHLNALANRLGAENGAARLEAGLKRLEAPATEAARRIETVGRAATHLGGSDGAARMAQGLKGVSEAGAQASRDVEALERSAARFGTGGGVTALARDLRAVAAPAGAARAEMADLGRHAARLGAGNAGARLAAGLRGAAEAGAGARREVADLSQAAARFGAVSTVSYLARDLRAAQAPAVTVKRGLDDVREATDRVGQGRGIRTLGEDLAATGRRAEEAQRRVDGLHRRTDIGRPSGRLSERHGFGNEALMASGLGGGLRFGMSGAAAGGLAVGTGVAAVAGGIAAASRQAISFESAMAEVRKAVNELSPEQFAVMERTILRTSRTTGIAKEEMAKLVAQAGFAGRPTEELARFAEFGAKAAGAFGMTADATGDALAKMGNVFKLPQAGIEDLADGVNLLGDSTAAKERQIVDFLYRAGGTGQALKFTALQTAAIGAAVISTGKEAEVAATGFNAFAMKLGTADRQGADFQKGLRAIGLTGRRVKAELAADPQAGFLNVLERINKLPENKKLDVASRIGGMEYGDDLIAYAGAVDGIRKAMALLQDQSTRSGSVEKTFKIFDATTERSIARAGTNFEAFAAKIGQRFTPAIRESAGVVERWFSGLTKALEVGDRAAALADKVAKGTPLSDADKAEMAADPKLKAETDRRVESGRETSARRAIVEEEGRERAKLPAQPSIADKARAGLKALGTVPDRASQAPDAEDAAAAQARERTRLRLQGDIGTLQGEIAQRKAGGYETTADRLRLRRLQQQYDRQFPAPAAAPPSNTPEPQAPGQAAPGTVPTGAPEAGPVPASPTPRAAPDTSVPPPPAPVRPVSAAPAQAPAPAEAAREIDAVPAPATPARRPAPDTPVPPLSPVRPVSAAPVEVPAPAEAAREIEAVPAPAAPMRRSAPDAPVLPPVADRPSPETPVSAAPRAAPPREPEAAPAAPMRREETSRQPSLPGADRPADLAEGVRASLAAYHGEVERGLARTERVVHDAGLRMRADLAISAKVDLASFRAAADGGARIETAAYSGGDRSGSRFGGGRSGGVSTSAFGAGGVGRGEDRASGFGGAGGGNASLPRVAPGRFGGMTPEQRGGAARFGGGLAGGSGIGRGGRPNGPEIGTPGAGIGRRSGESGTPQPDRGAVGPDQAGGFVDPRSNPNVNQGVLDRYGARRLPVVLRNNNPAALSLMNPGSGREFAERQEGYVGATPRPANEGGYYAKYATPEHGVAANAELLKRYGAQGIDTPNQIVRKWSTDQRAWPAYAARIAKAAGVGANDRIDLSDAETRGRIIEAKSAHESGTGQPIYSHETFMRGARREFPAAGQGTQQARREGPTSSTSAAGANKPGENGQFDPLGGAARRYSSGYGMREHPVHGGHRMHHGQDMAAPAGTAVNSMQAGRISNISRQGDVTVTHPDGSTKTYRHIAPAGVREGQDVEAGGPIGRLRANDPRSTGPHLHLEATDPQGRRYDPRGEIEAAQRAAGAAAAERQMPQGQPQEQPERPAEPANRPAPTTPVPVPERAAARARAPDRLGVLLGALGRRREAGGDPGIVLEPKQGAPGPIDPGIVATPKGEVRNTDPGIVANPAQAKRWQPGPVAAPAELEEGRKRRLPERDDPRAPSPRFAEPRMLEVRARSGGEGEGGGRGGGRGGPAAGPPAIQNFYGGFDEQGVARRAKLEQNREIRRTQARALHDIGRIA